MVGNPGDRFSRVEDLKVSPVLNTLNLTIYFSYYSKSKNKSCDKVFLKRLVDVFVINYKQDLKKSATWIYRTYLDMRKKLTHQNISLDTIQRRKKIGPKTDPWGTPDNTATRSEA